MKLSDIKEGWFGKKQDAIAPSQRELSDEERALIKRIFPNTNANLKMGSGRYVFPHNAVAWYRTGRLAFFVDGDTLKVNVGLYKSEDETSSPTGRPITHTKDYVVSEDELERIKHMLDGV